LVNVPLGDRSVLWRLTRERYYQVPVLKDGRQVIFETHPDSQVVAKYLENRFTLGLFPREWEGLQDLLWRYFENDVEGATFRLNDIHWREFVPASERCGYVRHKERRFGRGCLDEWRQRQGALLEELETLLRPAEQMLATRPFLLTDRPLFSDFCLYGMLANFLFSGHYELPAVHAHLRDWYPRMSKIRLSTPA
jgi:glutathione S-transferase